MLFKLFNASKKLNIIRYLSQYEAIVDGVYPQITKKKTEIMDTIKEKAAQVGKSKLGQKIKVAKEYAVVEMAPPINEIQQIRADLALTRKFIKSGSFSFLSVKQAWLLTLVCLEVGLWFYLGETIGKWHTVGYKV